MIIIITKWYILGVLPFIVWVLVWIFKIMLPTHRENWRLSSTAKSPILNHINETSSGGTTIKAFGNDRIFQQKCFQLLENDLLVCINLHGTRSWLNLRINLICIGILVFSVSICIWLRFSISPVLIGLTL